jgi:hypothetical protein
VKSLFDPAVRTELEQRVRLISPDSRALWGKFSPQGMLAHLTQSARMALGDLHVPLIPRPLIVRKLIKVLLFYVVPFPKSAPTARELLTPDPTPVEPLRDELITLMRRIADGPREGIGPAHPLFGPLSYEDWARLAWLHTDHHLRQFGV